MGAVLAKFRKAKTTTEILEKLEEEIQQIEKFSINTQEKQKRLVGNFLAISIGLYALGFLTFYFVFFPPSWTERITYSVPLLIFPLVIIVMRKALAWFFQRRLNKNSSKLRVLRAEKKKILEKVMDKETYKVAVDLLNRFGDKSNGLKAAAAGALTPRVVKVSTLGTIATIGSQNTSLSNTPRQARPGIQGQQAVTPQNQSLQELRRRTPYPIINQQDKGVLEKMVDYLVGDGPQNRFAMICKQCFSHNGMALQEEFEYATFRCAFCNTLNPSRKSRPVAPKLPNPNSFLSASAINASRLSSSSSTSSSSDDSDDASEKVHKQVPEIIETKVTQATGDDENSETSSVTDFKTPEKAEDQTEKF